MAQCWFEREEGTLRLVICDGFEIRAVEVASQGLQDRIVSEEDFDAVLAEADLPATEPRKTIELVQFDPASGEALLDSFVGFARQVSVRAVGGASNRRWSFSVAGPAQGRPEPIEVDPHDALGSFADDLSAVELDALIQALTNSRHGVKVWWSWRNVPADGSIALRVEGGMSRFVSGWRTERIAENLRREGARRKAADDLTQQDAASYWADVTEHGFVMPYNFVPLAPGRTVEAQRHRPAGHDRQHAGLYTGTLEFDVTSISPLLLRSGATRVDGDHDVSMLPRRPDGRVSVWGSTLKGSLRALYEALTGSCLRVFDEEFSPVYRDPVVVRPAGWCLATITQCDGRGPTSVNLCHETVWVPVDDLPRQPKTGDLFRVAGGTRRERHSREELIGAAVSRAAAGETSAWTILVTSAGARGRHPWSWALGRVGGDLMEVTPEAVGRFADEVYGTADSVKAREPANARVPKAAPDRFAPVERDRTIVGHRLAALESSLTPGTPVWVQVENGKVSRIALSAVWRSKSTATRGGDRVDPGHRACADAEHLCPACRVFGSVEVRNNSTAGTLQGDGSAEQRAYRGHVRPVELVSIDPVQPKGAYLAVGLPPLRGPRPGAGQTYLQLARESEGRNAASDTSRPLREWGSTADRSPRIEGAARAMPAKINGRKTYWMTSPLPAAVGRQRFTPNLRNGADNIDKWADLVPDGTPFTGRLAFDNLTSAELGALLAILRPQLLWGENGTRFGWTLGGGKPIGLGVVHTTALRVTTWSPEDRYAQSAGTSTELQEADMSELVRTFERETDPEVQAASWPALKALLTIDRVPGQVVNYPMSWPAAIRPTDHRSYRQGEPDFNYWRNTTGTFAGSPAGKARLKLRILPTADSQGTAQANSTGDPIVWGEA